MSRAPSRRAVRAARRAEHIAARYAAAAGDARLVRGVAWDDYRAAVELLPADERPIEDAHITGVLRARAADLRRK